MTIAEARLRAYQDSGRAALVSGTTALITIVALLIIATSIVCLTIKGVDALRGVFYPLFLPAVGMLLLALPFGYISYHYQQLQAKHWQELVEKLKIKIDQEFAAIAKKEQSAWLLENILGGDRSIVRAQNLIIELKRFYPEKKDPITEALDILLIYLVDPEAAKKKKEENS